jgi:hypothetical protein
MPRNVSRLCPCPGAAAWQACVLKKQKAFFFEKKKQKTFAS